ncbi:hypothetical protein DFP73DRAFT_596114 [Morchella snyderi]|nr:hypothetical protein DFP73DRAFT_596114 [Morchella snyderi]
MTYPLPANAPAALSAVTSGDIPVSAVPAPNTNIKKRKSLAQVSPLGELMKEIKVDDQIYMIPSELPEGVFHHVRNMVVSSLKAVVADGANASPSDLALAYGPLVPVESDATLVRTDPTSVIVISDSESDQPIVIRYRRKRLDRTSRSVDSNSIITKSIEPKPAASEPATSESPVPGNSVQTVHVRRPNGKIRVRGWQEVGDFLGIDDAVAKTRYSKQWVSGKYIEGLILLNGKKARTKQMDPACTSCAKSKGRHKTQCAPDEQKKEKLRGNIGKPAILYAPEEQRKEVSKSTEKACLSKGAGRAKEIFE